MRTSTGGTASIIIGLLLVLFGSIFALQGVGVIPGSFMSNNSTWIYVGGTLVLIGLILLVFAKRSRFMKPSGSMTPTSTNAQRSMT